MTLGLPTGYPPEWWRGHLNKLREFGRATWHDEYLGPPPTDPACQAPLELLSEFGYRKGAPPDAATTAGAPVSVSSTSDAHRDAAPLAVVTDDVPTVPRDEPPTGQGHESAINFLTQLRPSGPWVLSAIGPDDKKIETTTVRTPEEGDEFIRRYNGKRNLYYSVNPTRRHLDSKAAKTDIAAIEYMLADLDPSKGESSQDAKKRYLQQLNGEFEPKPTAVVDSGNGIQCLWKLETRIILREPVSTRTANGKEKLAFSPEDQAKIDDVEERVETIMHRLGSAAGTQNIDRILRVPGTINLPNEVKRKAGRSSCPSELLWFNGVSYPLDAFPKDEPEDIALLDSDNPLDDLQTKVDSDTPERGDDNARLKSNGLDDLVLLGKTAERLRTLIKQGQVEGLSFSSRSEACLHVACELLRAGKPNETILAVLLDPANGISAHHHEQSDPKRAARRTLDAALERQERARPPIKVVNGEIARVVDEAEQALIRAGVPVMVRAGALYQPIAEMRPAADGSKTEVTILGRMNHANLSYVLNKHAATFVRWDGRGRCWRRIDPPGAVAATLLNKGKWQLPKVVGVITAPTLRPDGSILSQPGYDTATQLWYAPAGTLQLPLIGEDRAAAQEALLLLKELIAEFRFESKLDRAVALAALMTPVLRGSCDVVPLIAILAHTASSGKSFLADLANTIVRAQKCPVITAPESQEEMEKRLGAIVLEGAQIVSLDNCSHNLGGDLLCQITERPLIRIRVLGKSEAPECEWRGTLFANGNNVLLVGDMTRRTIICNLDPQMERPELRRFRFNPIGSIVTPLADVAVMHYIQRGPARGGNNLALRSEKPRR